MVCAHRQNLFKGISCSSCHQEKSYHFNELRKTLYLSLVRSHLVYGTQLWHPHLIKDIHKLEKVLLSIYSKTGILITRTVLVFYHLLCGLKNPLDNFNIMNYISFVSSNTRASSNGGLEYQYKRTNIGRRFCQTVRGTLFPK